MVVFLLDNGAEVIEDGERVIHRLSDYDTHDTDGRTARTIIDIIKERMHTARLSKF